MNRPLLIVLGIVLILLIVAVWVYLIFFGTPKNSAEVFTNLGFQHTSQPVTITPPTATTTPSAPVATSSPATPILKQLTKRAVAGYTYIEASSSSSTIIRYVEKGTGHIYQIDPTSLQETLISGTTIPAVSSAVFSPNGKIVAFTSYDGYTAKVFVGTIGSSQNVTGVDLPPNAKNVAFKNNHTVYYTIATNGTIHGYEQDLAARSQTELFAVNFTNFKVFWGNGLTKIYLVTKPASDFQSFIYTVRNNQLTPVGEPHYDLTARPTNDRILESYANNNNYTASVFDETANEIIHLPIRSLSDKCMFDPVIHDYVWCAAQLLGSSQNYLTDWYKGTVRSDDYIWRINLSTQEASLYANPHKLMNTSLDVENMMSDPYGESAIFTNKTDSSLWWVSLRS